MEIICILIQVTFQINALQRKKASSNVQKHDYQHPRRTSKHIQIKEI